LENSLYVWTPDQLAQSCASGPTITLAFPNFGALAIAFDSDGNLWEPVLYPHTPVLGYRAADLKAGATPTAAWSLTGYCLSSLDSLCGPNGLAFDADGYLWVGDESGLKAFSRSTRTGLDDGGPNGTGPFADFHITTPCGALSYDGGHCLYAFGNLAFDVAGTLWAHTIHNGGLHHLVAYSRAQLQNATNDDQPSPVRDLVLDGGSKTFANFSGTLAFDADGNLWVGGFSNWDADEPNLFRFPRALLALDAGSDDPSLAAPDISIEVPGAPSLSLAFSPIPPGLPLQP
jgi:sugar lactone lactonase YvrE